MFPWICIFVRLTKMDEWFWYVILAGLPAGPQLPISLDTIYAPSQKSFTQSMRITWHGGMGFLRTTLRSDRRSVRHRIVSAANIFQLDTTWNWNWNFHADMLETWSLRGPISSIGASPTWQAECVRQKRRSPPQVGWILMRCDFGLR